MTKFIVTLRHNGNLFYLRSTVWTSEASRATIYDTEAGAVVARAKAKMFMKVTQWKASRIEAVTAA
jgi:hypothetical protein